MKNIIKFSILLIIVFFTNCSEESKDPIVESNGFTLRKDSSIVSPNILTSTDEANVFGKFDWDVSNNGSASVSSYTLVVFDKDNDPNLEKPVEYSGTGVEVTATSRKATLTVKEFNSLINNLKTYKCSEMNIDVRIKSTLGANPETAYIQYSSPVNFKVTGYATIAPMLAFVKEGN
jgi:starch-binding outer membrane protein SusE/F